MHHAPAGPPLSARLRGALTRWVLLARRALGRRRALVFGILVSAVVTAVVLGVPVVSGSPDGTPPVALDASASSSSSASEDGSPVVMGWDGKPVPATSSAEDAETSAPASSEAWVAGSASSASAGTGGAPTGSVPPAGAPSSTPRTTPSTTVPPRASAQPPTPDVVPTPETLAPEEQVLALVNAARNDEGCGALVPDASLAELALAHSAGMRDSGVLDLVLPGGGSLLDLGGRAATLARGTDPAEVVEGWLADSDARTAILDCSLGTVGIGVVDGTWWTQLLA